MRGVIEKLHGTFGFIRGQNKVGYFFVPSSFSDPLIMFESLSEGQRVEFAPNDAFPKGPRAANVELVADSVADLPDEAGL